MNALKLYWSSGLKDGRKNFGDWLSPLIVSHLAGRAVVHADPQNADLIAVGSILQRLKHRFWNRRLDVWGSGFIEDGPALPLHHRYHALRGKYSAARVPQAKPSAYGDPGLLSDLLLPEYGDMAREGVGIVPHYKDVARSEVSELRSRLEGAKTIDVLCDDPLDVLRQIARCRFIVSSSLHGLVVADSFGIPNAWVEFSDEVRGGRFKFKDYYSAFALSDAVPASLSAIDAHQIERASREYTRPGLDEIKAALIAAFPYAK